MSGMNVQNNLTETMQRPDYRPEIVEALQSSLTPKVKQERLLGYHERDLAAALEVLESKERTQMYQMLTAEALADILEYSENQIKYMGEISMPKRIAVLSQFEIAEMAEYIRNMDKTDRITGHAPVD